MEAKKLVVIAAAMLFAFEIGIHLFFPGIFVSPDVDNRDVALAILGTLPIVYLVGVFMLAVFDER